MRFRTTSELSLGGEKLGVVAGAAATAEGAAADGAGLGADSCAKTEPLKRSSGARTRTVDRGVRPEAKLKMELLDVGVSRSVP